MAVRRVVEPACPSSWWAEPSARASKSDLSSDTHVREVLGQASPRTCRTGQSERSVYAVMEWLALAQWYKFQFDACTGLPLRLSPRLKTKINNLMAVKERKNALMDFGTIFHGLHE
ncbi:hypothetical protein PSTG_02273 [Puccinia striiformis f. sp. tritici PST-78]|uniref:Uncharacterized protein n=1 Tax=Puccinia striiformis f. sp. tritici PST-78 TaxID=1165861 RepID=A0A0L0VYL5_9BASI|nr:hypothetical protein PSTG_02273 [Puccinia striiformis f. sp. tritici PST-78]